MHACAHRGALSPQVIRAKVEKRELFLRLFKRVEGAEVGGAEVGVALQAQPIDGLFFTGSHATGARIAQALGPRLVKLQLELGGKDPTYVCDDADPQMAAESLADGAMYNTGQSCCSVERIYVHEAIYETFVTAFLATVHGFKLGDPTAEDTYIGAIPRAAARCA